MGYAKRILEEREARGYVGEDGTRVCHRCVSDRYLRTLLESSEAKSRCSFCKRRSSAAIDVLLEAVLETMRHYYSDPADELPYVSAEGGYQGEVLDTREALMQLSTWTNNDALHEYVADSIDTDTWCNRNYFGLSHYQQLQHGWDAFACQIRHHTRFLFFPESPTYHSRHSDGILPQDVLEQLGALLEQHELITSIETDRSLLRARVVKVGQRPSSAYELGTAPADCARASNRMSPAGIPMFYGAFDADTAIAETYEPRQGRRREIAMATFAPTRRLRVVNLVDLPSIPSMFDPTDRSARESLRFLHDFSAELSRPVDRDGREHSEYAPTQVVTEYIRHRFRPGGKTLDGIVYRSAKHAAGNAVVIFATSEQCQPSTNSGSEQLLKLSSVTYMPASRRRRRACGQRR